MNNQNFTRKDWSKSCVHSEITLHQLSPYIGKLKSSIAGELISEYSRPGELIIDPFCGAGTIPLEAISKGRNIFASDSSSYSILLTKAKLNPPQDLKSALHRCKQLLNLSFHLPNPNLDLVPEWVKKFYHPKTLRETLRFVNASSAPKDAFYLACLMGLLHHQRPGFLSYPSSHLVPYLRTNKFPRKEHPELFEYRELEPRILAKVHRAFKRTPKPNLKFDLSKTIRKSRIENVTLPKTFDCVLTSPPYMNALDYERDNRLRLWFLDQHSDPSKNTDRTNKKSYFNTIMNTLISKSEQGLKKDGRLILVLGNTVSKGGVRDLVAPTLEIIEQRAPSLTLIDCLVDTIPDIRRSRRSSTAVREENIMVFRKK